MTDEKNDNSAYVIDKGNSLKITAILVDKDGNEVDMQETVTKLDDFLQKKLTETDTNSINSQIYPFISQLFVYSLHKMVGEEGAAPFLVDNRLQNLVLDLMMVSFSFYKMMQAKEYSIETSVEDIDIEEYIRDQTSARLEALVVVMNEIGVDPQKILDSLIDDGKITDEEAETVMDKYELAHDDFDDFEDES